MSVTTQEQSVKNDHRDLKKEQVVRFKFRLHNYFNNFASLGFVPENIAIFGSYLAISLFFVLDVISDPVTTFHLLYIFPLTVIALHSSRTSLVVGAVVLSISLQVCELLFFQDRVVEIPVFLFLIIVFSNILCTLVTRYARFYVLEAQQLSTTDPLTRLYNRRGLDQELESEIVRQRRYGGYFSLAIIDLDGFKGLNDTLGHPVGDKVLVLFADILRKQMRKIDTIARFGGDEFVILMPNTQAPDCHALCQLLCYATRLTLTEAFSYPLSISIGFTTSENSTATSDDLLSIADKALYRAKAFGKGCVVRDSDKACCTFF